MLAWHITAQVYSIAQGKIITVTFLVYAPTQDLAETIAERKLQEQGITLEYICSLVASLS